MQCTAVCYAVPNQRKPTVFTHYISFFCTVGTGTYHCYNYRSKYLIVNCFLNLVGVPGKKGANSIWLPSKDERKILLQRWAYVTVPGTGTQYIFLYCNKNYRYHTYIVKLVESCGLGQERGLHIS